MQSLSSIKKILKSPFVLSQKQTNPESAYNLWASTYDRQPDNLMLALDEQLFSGLITDISLKEKVVVDVGCGTGRHWEKLMAKDPKKLIGYDISEGMLTALQNKFPDAQTHKLSDNHLIGLEDESCDIIISTLTVAHIENIEEAFKEWDRVLKPGGEIIITDYHPELLSKGGNRTFKHNDRLIAVKNNIYPVSAIRKISGQLGWAQLRFIEREIDQSMRPYYEMHNALHLFEQFKGVHLIYGIYLKKLNAAL